MNGDSKRLEFILVEPDPNNWISTDWEITDGQGKEIAWLSPFFDNAEQYAHLITAAPDMLAACEKALHHLEQRAHVQECKPRERDECDCNLRQAKAKLHAAIAKAKGQP